MAILTPTCLQPTVATDGTPIPTPCAANAARTTINAYCLSAENAAQLTCAMMEQLAIWRGNGCCSGGAISAGAGLSVSIAALSAVAGTWIATDAASTLGGLTASITNYVWLRQDGTFTATATSAAPATGDGHGSALLMGTATCDGASVTAVTNDRVWLQRDAYVLVTPGSDADVTLTAAQHVCRVIKLATGSWTADHNVIVPAYGGAQWTVINGSSKTATVKTTSGTGIAVATGKTAILAGDGTNIVRVTADA